MSEVKLRTFLVVNQATRTVEVTVHKDNYDAASHCVLTTHGEPLVAFETGAGGLAPLDGKAVEVTIIERMG